MRLVFILLSIVLPAARVSAQSSACNNNTRTLQAAAGTTPAGSQSCASVTFTINVAGSGVTITTPANCSTGSTVRSDDTFSCGPSAPGIHCTAQGFQVNVKVYSTGSGSPCPTIPDTLPTTLAGARALAQCISPPMISSVYTWSAKVQNCPTGTGGDPRPEGAVLSNGYEQYVVRNGDPDALLAPPPANAVLDQLLALETESISSLPSDLREVRAIHPAIPGVRNVTARITDVFADVPGHGEVVNAHFIEGTVTADGRFHVSDTFRALAEGAPVPVVQDLAYDGASFFSGIRGNPYYAAYSATSSRIRSAMATEAGFLDGLLDWVRFPFAITLFPGTVRTVETLGPDGDSTLVRVVETYPGVFASPAVAGKTIYVLSVGNVTHPVSIEHRDAEDNLVTRHEYSEYRSLAAGVWRPTRIVQKEFVAGSSTPYLVRTMQIVTATLMTASEAEDDLGRPRSADNLWFVRQ